jgi:hypothetical protein
VNEQTEKLIDVLIQVAKTKATFYVWDSRGERAEIELAKAKAELVAEIDKLETKIAVLLSTGSSTENWHEVKK